MNNSFGLKEHDPSILSSTKMETVALLAIVLGKLNIVCFCVLKVFKKIIFILFFLHFKLIFIYIYMFFCCIDIKNKFKKIKNILFLLIVAMQAPHNTGKYSLRSNPSEEEMCIDSLINYIVSDFAFFFFLLAVVALSVSFYFTDPSEEAMYI